MTPEEFLARIQELERQVNALSDSSKIPRNIETALRERLGISTSSTGYIAGNGTMAAGILDITNASITSSSRCVATRSGTADSSAFPQLATGYLSGTTMRIFEGSFTKTWSIDYIIVF